MIQKKHKFILIFIMIQSGCLRDVEVLLSAMNVKTCKIDNLQRIFSDPDFGDHSNLVLQLRKYTHIVRDKQEVSTR